MRRIILLTGLVVITVLVVLLNCTVNSTTTHNYYYTNGSDTLVVADQRDTGREGEPESAGRPDPETEPESNPQPDPEDHELTDTTWVECLDPGTARVEITCIADENLVIYRMFDNILGGSGFRFEMNFEKRDYIDGGRDIYCLIFSFNSMNPWVGTESGETSSARVETLAPTESTQISTGGPFLTLDINGVKFTYELDDIAMINVEALAIGSNNVMLWLPASESMFSTIASGTSGSVVLVDGDKTNNRSIDEENFINFDTFVNTY